MTLASFVERYGRAIVAITIILAAAGLISAVQLPADIYPPLIFPRVVVIGHGGPEAREALVVLAAEQHGAGRAGDLQQVRP